MAEFLTQWQGHAHKSSARPHSIIDARAGKSSAKTDWYRISNMGPASAEVWLYDAIGWYGVTAEDFVRDIKDLNTNTIILHLNSPGGDVFDGVAIYNTLKAHSASVEIRIEGLAASAASLIAMAGDTIKIGRNAQMMIHRAWGIEIGNTADMLKYAEELEKIDGTIADTYARKAGGTVQAWSAAMEAETWYTGPEAVAAGLADALLDSDEPDTTDDVPVDRSNSWDMSIFAHKSRAEAPAPYMPGTDEPAKDVTADAGTETPPIGESDTKWQDARKAALSVLGG